MLFARALRRGRRQWPWLTRLSFRSKQVAESSVDQFLAFRFELGTLSDAAEIVDDALHVGFDALRVFGILSAGEEGLADPARQLIDRACKSNPRRRVDVAVVCSPGLATNKTRMQVFILVHGRSSMSC